MTSEERFIAQSIADNQADFLSSIKGGAATWDWVVLTASNERQADAYQLQLDRRLADGALPAWCKYLVVADPGGRRCGSGGATLNAYARIADAVGVDEVPRQKILMIHSGGDSKRLPQYSAKGKLFSPAPHALPGGARATLFDDLMVAVAGIPSRVQGGTLVLPSDTEVAFNPLQLDLESVDAAGLSMKAPVAEGTEHGVFLEGENGAVSRFLHKLSERELNSAGAVDSRGMVDIDTGCIWLGSNAVDALMRVISAGDEIELDKLGLFGGPEACLSLYSDFLYPMGSDASLADYLAQAPEGAVTQELDTCRRELWTALSPLSIKLMRLSPSRYLHFGTTWEMLDLVTKDVDGYEYLGWRRQVLSACAAEDPALSNAIIAEEASVPGSSYIEDAKILGRSSVGDGSVVSCVNLQERKAPRKVVLSGMPLVGGKWVCRIYGTEDNPKESSGASYLGTTIDSIIEATGVARESVWDSAPASIWNAKLFPVCDDEKAALDAALLLFRIASGEASDEEVRAWVASDRESLASSFAKSDVAAILSREDALADEVAIAKFEQALQSGSAARDAETALGTGACLARRCEQALAKARSVGFPLNMRMLLALSDLALVNGLTFIDGSDPSSLEDEAYGIVRDGILGAVCEEHPVLGKRATFKKDAAECDLPVRVNFCGSPSDAAPYCVEHGGTMLDGALLLKGRLPVHAEAQRLDEFVIVLESADQNASRAFTEIADVRRCGDPGDPFALHKACITVAGVLQGFGSIQEFCEAAGGGLRLATSVEVPKGSGLGTSSILAAACCRVLDELFGLGASDDLVFDQVFAAEQVMGTCGGWQDQVGGLVPGIKFFTSRPGMLQRISVEQLDLDPQTAKELESRFALVFSGQRRLARNVLRSETNALAKNERPALEVVARIQELCALMRYHLLKGDVTAFAKCMDEQLECVKVLDEGATNTCVDYIFEACDDLVDGRSVCGAGGGGFLQMILKEGVARRDLVDRVESAFGGCGVEVWDASFCYGTGGRK